MNKIVSISFAILCLLSSVFLIGFKISVKANSDVIYVPTDYPTIQEAINVASSGDTVFVYNGTYYEYVVVNKSISLIGENKSTTIVDGENVRPSVISVRANGVNITGFTVRNGFSWGISAWDVNSCHIYNNIIRDTSSEGISLNGSKNGLSHNAILNCGNGMMIGGSKNTVYKNNLTNNYHGIRVGNAENIIIDSNSCSNNTSHGIYLYGVNNVTIINNNLSNNREYGIYVEEYGDIPSTNNTLLGNQIVNNSVGICLLSFYNSRLHGNNITANDSVGISLLNSLNNSISGNSITNNEYGIWLADHSNNNIISGNNITKNMYSIKFYYYSSNNFIYHNNFVINTFQVLTDRFSVNVWDNGYPSGGNYWSDYTDEDLYSGPYQNETGYDWIGDTPYVIDENNQDNYPLMDSFAPKREEMRIAYRNLLLKYSELFSGFETLSSTLYISLSNITDLQRRYDSLLTEINNMQEQINSLNSTCKNLQELIYDLIISFNSTHDNLQEQINSLNSTYLHLYACMHAMVGYTKGVTETFTVPPSQEVVRTVGLCEGEEVSGSIIVSGGTGNDINFYVTDPNGNTIRRFDRSTHTSFSFKSSITGTYTLHFDNSFSIISSKSVTLSYTISKPIFGLAPELFYLLVIVIIVIVAMIVVAFALKRRKPAAQPQ